MNVTTNVSGGNRMAQRMAELRQRLQKNSGVFVGLPRGAGSYEDGTPIAVIGAIQEFGSADGRIPERSFLRAPLRANVKLLNKIMKELLPQVVGGQMTMFQLMEAVGARAAAVSQEAIEAGIAPANAPSTIASKGKGKQALVDDGFLRQQITYVVEEGEQ